MNHFQPPAQQLQHPLLQHDYQGFCWWCGNTADSREHRHKKADVVRAFGSGPWPDPVVRVRSGSKREDRIQGPNSAKLKFAKVLCANCNNVRSQSFDLAYDVFAEYIHQNSDVSVKAGVIQFSRVYGKGWRDERRALTKYLVKNICCRLAEGRVQIPQPLICFMDGSVRDLPNLTLEMNINMAKYEMGVHLRDAHCIEGGSLWMGDHGIIYDSQTSPVGTFSHLGFDWFNVDYQVLFGRRKGRANFFSGDIVRLERFWPEGLSTGDALRACRDCNPS
ncbi:hypothetical protein [Streptomyces sp. NPDC005141]